MPPEIPQPKSPHLFTIHKGEDSYAVIDTPSQYWVIPVDDIKNLNHLDGGNESIDLDDDLFREFLSDHNLVALETSNGLTDPYCLQFIPELLEVVEVSTSWATEFITLYEKTHNGLQTVTPSEKLEIKVG